MRIAALVPIVTLLGAVNVPADEVELYAAGRVHELGTDAFSFPVSTL